MNYIWNSSENVLCILFDSDEKFNDIQKLTQKCDRLQFSLFNKNKFNRSLTEICNCKKVRYLYLQIEFKFIGTLQNQFMDQQLSNTHTIQINFFFNLEHNHVRISPIKLLLIALNYIIEKHRFSAPNQLFQSNIVQWVDRVST